MRRMNELKKLVRMEVSTCFYPTGMEPVEFEEESLGTIFTCGDQGHALAWNSLVGHDSRRVCMRVLPTEEINFAQVAGQSLFMDFKRQQWTPARLYVGQKPVKYRTYTQHLEYACGIDGGVITISYDLWSADSQLGQYSMEVFYS